MADLHKNSCSFFIFWVNIGLPLPKNHEFLCKKSVILNLSAILNF
jgi:hypothetical protein